MPDPDRLLRTIARARQAICATVGRKGRFLELADADELMIAGDLHGHLGNFQTLYQRAALADHPRRHLVLQEVIHGKFRYPRGGDKSHQILDLFCALKTQFPQQVHLLLGNHELSQWTRRPIIKGEVSYNQLFLEGIQEAYRQRADEIAAGYDSLFEVLPLAMVTPNRIFLSHSIPTASQLANFQLAMLAEDSLPTSALEPKGSLFALLWGRDSTAANVSNFLGKVDADWLVTGHLHPESGFEIPSARHIILDSSSSPAAWCWLPANRALTPEEFRASIQML